MPLRVCYAVLGHYAVPATSTSVRGRMLHTCIVTSSCKRELSVLDNAVDCVLHAAELLENATFEQRPSLLLAYGLQPGRCAQVTQPNQEQAAVVVEPVQPAAEGAFERAVVAESEQPAAVVVQPLVATDATAAAAVVDAAAALNEAVINAAAAQIGAIAAGISADTEAAAALGGAVAAAAAGGATATAGASGNPGFFSF